jgi:hypothetical protein
MRRPVSVLIALVVMAAMLVALAAPALANHRDFFDRFDNRFEDCFFVDGVLVCDDDFDRDFFDRDFFDRDRFDFDGDFAQEVEQDAESGDVDQSFDVSQTGDNSNQCAGIQGVANTGNAQNAVGLGVLGGDFDDFEIDDSGASIDVSGSSDTSCDQEVNQAAAASAHKW